MVMTRRALLLAVALVLTMFAATDFASSSGRGDNRQRSVRGR